MAVKAISLQHRNKLASKYVKGELKDLFPYDPFHSAEKRINDLQHRSFPREELVSVLTTMNEDWGAPNETIRQIERLRNDDSVVVIGGQQAGLLTGPLYTIHKIISIIKYAKEQEARLNIPVIPMFWIAGEDHDYDEINHIYTSANEKLNKRVTDQKEWQRRSVSHIPLDKSLTKDWIKQVFFDLTETEYTKNLALTIFDQVDQSETFVDFFARLIFQLFEESGLVLVDSGNMKLRDMQSAVFEQLIMHQPSITNAIYKTSEKIKHNGFSVQVDVTEQDGNLFYHDEQGERILLIRSDSQWIGKNDEVSFTTDEMIQMAQHEPRRLSNNVMTRPIMQEALFPTLAFVAGDGEISYWALLKDAFSAYHSSMIMPPIIPRLSITLITERMDKLMENRTLDPSYIVNNGCKKLKMNWLTTQQNPPINLLFEQAENSIKEVHEPVQALAHSIGPDLGSEATRNLNNILREIHYLKNRTINQLQEKYTEELTKFQELQLSLRPNDGLQERVLNIVSFMNECGASFIRNILEQDLSFEEDHHLIYINRLV